MRKKARTHVERFRDFLERMGFDADVSRDGESIDVIAHELSFFVEVPPQAGFMRIVHPDLCPIRNARQRDHVEKLAHEITANIWVAKVFVFGSATWASIEVAVSSPEEAQKIFELLFDNLIDAIERFTESYLAWYVDSAFYVVTTERASWVH